MNSPNEFKLIGGLKTPEVDRRSLFGAVAEAVAVGAKPSAFGRRP